MFEGLRKKLASFIGGAEEKALDKAKREEHKAPVELGLDEEISAPAREPERQVTEKTKALEQPIPKEVEEHAPPKKPEPSLPEEVDAVELPIREELVEDVPVKEPEPSIREQVGKPIPPVEPQAPAREKPKLSVKTKFKAFFSRKITLSEGDISDLLDSLHLALIQSDVGVEAADYFVSEIRRRLVGVEVDSKNIHGHITDSLKNLLLETLTAGGSIDVLEKIRKSSEPYVILFLGVNGTGKTTTIAKFAQLLKENGLSVVLAAGDTFRAGAIEQLETHAGRLGVKLITHSKGADSAAVVYDAVEHAKARGIDVVLADSAGRMQTNVNLMDELAKIVRVNKPSLKVFVGDSLTGNDAVEQARKFDEMAGVDAIILTKMDADAKGGCALSITHAIKKPVIYVGMGQSLSDLKPFDPKWFVDQLI